MYSETLMIQAVGLGLVISLIFSETLGLAAGGMVVPGYIALMVHYPMRILGTVIVALVTFWAMRFFSNFMFIYGRRRIVLVILLGFAFGWLSREFLIINYQGISVEMQAIGYIIPGLIANWMERQGVIPTISTMIIAAVLIRMFLMILSGGEVLL